MFFCIIAFGYSKTFRSYDNRLRPTDRRPDLYLEQITINDVTGPIAQSVLEVRDERCSLEFGKSTNFESKRKAMDWLWSYKGKLLVICTPYHKGVHYAKHPCHFIPIINHLAQLHEQGFVHGDIRAYNMVLQYDSLSSEIEQRAIGTSSGNAKGWLIDFDYGGKNGGVEYPKGYQDLLKDGKRPGEAGNMITIMDDWKSLINLLFHAYYFEDKKGVSLTEETNNSIYSKCRKLEYYRNCKVKVDDPLLSNWDWPAKILLDYIDQISNIYDVTLDQVFESNLMECGLMSTSKAVNPSKAATGSPKKGSNRFGRKDTFCQINENETS